MHFGGEIPVLQLSSSSLNFVVTFVLFRGKEKRLDKSSNAVEFNDKRGCQVQNHSYGQRIKINCSGFGGVKRDNRLWKRSGTVWK